MLLAKVEHGLQVVWNVPRRPVSVYVRLKRLIKHLLKPGIESNSLDDEPLMPFFHKIFQRLPAQDPPQGSNASDGEEDHMGRKPWEMLNIYSANK